MISFQLEEEQKILRDTLFSLAKEEIQPRAREWDEARELDRALLKKGWEIGLLSVTLREILEEKKRSLLNNILALEELAYGDLSYALALFSSFAVAIPLALFGTEEQKEKFLKRYLGEEVVLGAPALTEPSYFFDCSNLKTEARRAGSEIVLKGIKAYVPFVEEAPFALVYALPETGGGVEAIEAFVLEKGVVGVKKKREKNMGILALPTYEIALEDIRIPSSLRLGEGAFDFPSLLSGSYLAKAALAVGVARASLEYAKEYAKTRVAFGEPIASRQSIAFMIAENAIEIDAARALTWEAAWKEEKKRGTLKDAWQAATYASEMAVMVCDRGVQILGGHGYIRDHPVEMWFRNARGFACWDGLAMV